MGKVNFGRHAYQVLVWIIFAWVALEFVHDYSSLLTDNFSLQVTLAIQVAVISAAVFAVLKLTVDVALDIGRSVWIILWVAMIVIGHHMAFILEMSSKQVLEILNLDQSISSLLLVSLIYAVALLIPFLPGLEIGVMIMILFGLPGVIASYLATVIGLSLAFFVGRLIANSRSGNAALARFEAHETWGARIKMLRETRTGRWRYVLLAVLVNTPGNSIVGGGGGISMICGFSGAFHPAPFILTLAVATSPISILVGTGILTAESLFF